MADAILKLVCRDIGGDHQRVHDKQTKYSGMTFKHALVPVTSLKSRRR